MAKAFKSFNHIEVRGLYIDNGFDSMGRACISVLVRKMNREPDIIEFTLAKPLAYEIRRRSYVKVEGHICSFSYFNKIREKQVNVQYFVADNVTLDVPHLTKRYGIEARHFDAAEFSADIQGTVVRVIETKNPDWAKLVIRTDSMEERDSRPSYIEVGYYKSRHLRTFDYVPGDHVLAWTTLRTQKKTLSDGTEHTFVNLIVEDIVLLDEEGNLLKQRPVKEEAPENTSVPSEMEIDLPDGDE